MGHTRGFVCAVFVLFLCGFVCESVTANVGWSRAVCRRGEGKECPLSAAYRAVRENDIVVCNALDYGAVGDGVTDDTEALRNALANCTVSSLSLGPNTTPANITMAVLYLPEGHSFLSGSLNLTSDQALYIAQTATLLGIQSLSAYPLVAPLPSYPVTTSKNSSPRYSALLSATNATNVHLLGAGTVDGQGAYWWRLYNGFPPSQADLELAASSLQLKTSEVDSDPSAVAAAVGRLRAAESLRGRVAAAAEGSDELTHTRPRLVEFLYSTQVSVEGVTMQNSPFWTLHPYVCRDVRIDGVRIVNPIWAPNADGIDPDSCTNVAITNSFIGASDDHISIKSGEDAEGMAFNTPCSNVLVENCTFGIGAGLATGSEVAAGIYDVLFKDNVFVDVTANIVRLKGCSYYPKGVRNVTFLNTHAPLVATSIYVSQFYECQDGSLPPSVQEGGFRDIFITNMTTSLALVAGEWQCSTSGCTDFHLMDVDFRPSFKGFQCGNATGTCDNVKPTCCL